MVLIHQLATFQAVFRLHFNMQLFNDLNEDYVSDELQKDPKLEDIEEDEDDFEAV